MSDEVKADQPRCYYGGGDGDHAWMITNNGRILCHDCPAELEHEEALRMLHEYATIVKTGISVLTDELEQMREDVRVAASSLTVDMKEAQVGSTVRRLLIANRLLIHARDEAIGRAGNAMADLKAAASMLNSYCHSLKNGPDNALAPIMNMILRMTGPLT